jgi:hypothetical protein
MQYVREAAKVVTRDVFYAGWHESGHWLNAKVGFCPAMRPMMLKRSELSALSYHGRALYCRPASVFHAAVRPA